MTYKNLMGIFPDKTASHISLLKYTKSACGVDFMLNTAESSEREGWFNLHERYKTDFFEFYFFRKASGFMFLDGDKIELHDNCVLIIPPFKRQEWHVQMENLTTPFLYFKKSLSITLSPTNILCTGCCIAIKATTRPALVWMQSKWSSTLHCSER